LLPAEAPRPQDTGLDEGLLWESLLEYIAAGRIVPVVGRDLLTIRDEHGVEHPLYVELARDLAVRLQKDLRTPLDLPDFADRSEVNPLGVVASQYLLKGGEWKRIYAHLKRVVDERPPLAVPDALAKLAAIEPFRLYLTATFDSLLTDAITAARGGRPKVHAFDPEKSFPDLGQDIDAGIVVFHMLGRVSPIANYVVTEEDAFEFAVVMLSKYMTNIVNLLGDKNLLIVGCRFPNWLVRFLLRVTRRKRLLHTTERADFVVDPSARENAELVQFLQTFHTQTEIFGTTPIAFVNELDRRWRELEAKRSPLPDAIKPCSVFLSYAREDQAIATEVAARISNNGPPVWFDRRELGAGDDWDRKIKRNIRQAAVFVPLLSRATLREGPRYVVAEWNCAIEYSKQWLGPSFILPLVIDDTDLNDTRILDEFKTVQASRRNDDGSLPADFLERLKEAFKSCQLRNRA
jgi:hypothetical protein